MTEQDAGDPNPSDGTAAFDDEREDDEKEDDEYIPDPDAPPTTEGRIGQGMLEMQKLLVSSLQATGLVGALVFLVDLVRQNGFGTSKGFLLGAIAATVNLWLLAGGVAQLARGSSIRALAALGGSFTALLVCCAYVVFYERSWTLGFALGLSIPAVGGMLYARLVSR
jgi:hypothetical protein